MKLVKCPRCELNYMKEDEKLCSVCRKELQGSDTEEPTDLCIECGEYPAVPGGELCVRCLRARVRAAKEAAALVKDDDPILADEDELLDDSEVSDMEGLEIELLEDVDVDEDEIPEDERGEIERELGMIDDDGAEDELMDEDDLEDSDNPDE